MTQPYRQFKFDMGGMFVYYGGRNLGEAITQFIKHRPSYTLLIETITEVSPRSYEPS